MRACMSRSEATASSSELWISSSGVIELWIKEYMDVKGVAEDNIDAVKVDTCDCGNQTIGTYTMTK